MRTDCFPHPLRGDDKVVTLLSITSVNPHDYTHDISLQPIDPPSVEDVLESFQQQHCNISDFAMMYAIYPVSKFSPSRCQFGNPSLAANKKHRYVIVWKDDVERQVPHTVRSTVATFTLGTEGSNQLPGFWTTEHPTRSRYYYGMLKQLYSQHVTYDAQDAATTSSSSPRGLRPSTRWFGYSSQRSSSTPIRTPGGGGPVHTPGRGHSARPSPWGPNTSPTISPSTGPELSVGTSTGVMSMLQRLLDQGATTARTIAADRETQTTVNVGLQHSIDDLSATLAALQRDFQNR